MYQILIVIDIKNNENTETTIREITEYFQKIDLKKKKIKKNIIYLFFTSN